MVFKGEDSHVLMDQIWDEGEKRRPKDDTKAFGPSSWENILLERKTTGEASLELSIIKGTFFPPI